MHKTKSYIYRTRKTNEAAKFTFSVLTRHDNTVHSYPVRLVKTYNTLFSLSPAKLILTNILIFFPPRPYKLLCACVCVYVCVCVCWCVRPRNGEGSGQRDVILRVSRGRGRQGWREKVSSWERDRIRRREGGGGEDEEILSRHAAHAQKIDTIT
jgi:hypothetical protein